MNYRDYKEIMDDEQLEESEAVTYYLNRAIYWNKSIKSLVKNYPIEVAVRIKPKFEEEKIKFILQALDIARFEKLSGVKIFEEGEVFIETVALEKIKQLNIQN